MTDLRALRHEYAARGLDEGDLDPDPLVVFRRWFDDAVAAGIDEPNAMVVATVDEDGAPSVRTVLLKGLEGDGFVFYTNHGSRKGRALAAEPRVALLFPWHPLERQVRVEGTAELLPRAEVEAYFAVRPRGSQLGAHASAQSEPVKIAHVYGKTGALEAYGKQSHIGLMMGLEYATDGSMEIDGRKIEVTAKGARG